MIRPSQNCITRSNIKFTIKMLPPNFAVLLISRQTSDQFELNHWGSFITDQMHLTFPYFMH